VVLNNGNSDNINNGGEAKENIAGGNVEPGEEEGAGTRHHRARRIDEATSQRGWAVIST